VAERRPLHRAHYQADVTHDPRVAHHHERARRIHLLRGKRVMTEPLVERVDAACKAAEVVINAEPLETQLAGAQLRDRGSARNSSTSSGTIVAGSSSAA